jgi:hypothetical protein
MRRRAPKHNTRAGWAEDVEQLLAEAFGESDDAAVPKPAPRGTTAPYRFDDFVFARSRRIDRTDA